MVNPLQRCGYTVDAIGRAFRTYRWGGPNNWYPYNTNNDLGCYWQCTVTSNIGETLVSVADFSYSNNWEVIDYDGGSMTFSGNPTSFSTSFDLPIMAILTIIQAEFLPLE